MIEKKEIIKLRGSRKEEGAQERDKSEEREGVEREGQWDEL